MDVQLKDNQSRALKKKQVSAFSNIIEEKVLQKPTTSAFIHVTLHLVRGKRGSREEYIYISFMNHTFSFVIQHPLFNLHTT